MLFILGLIGTIVIGFMIFTAYAMALMFLLVAGAGAGLCIMLYLGIAQAIEGNNSLLIAAVVLWVVAMLVGMNIYQSKNNSGSPSDH
jgi:hypothetical protein